MTIDNKVNSDSNVASICLKANQTLRVKANQTLSVLGTLSKLSFILLSYYLLKNDQFLKHFLNFSSNIVL